jgi:hypothetical protein
MTAYQAVRPHAQPLLPRRRVAVPVRRGRHIEPISVVLAGVVLAFLLALVYLGQTVNLGATNYQYEQLIVQRDDLLRQVTTAEAGINRFAAEQWVLDQAQRAGLAPLGNRLLIPAR